MIINHVTHSTEKLASFRYFCLIQIPYLEKMGHKVIVSTVPDYDADIVIFNKHGNTVELEYAKECKKRGISTIFHICDNHFVTKNRDYYEAMCNEVEKITCTIPELASTIHQFTGKEPAIIPDPYYYDEQEIKYEPGDKLKLCWFGHPSNLDGLFNILDKLKGYDLEVVTNQKQVPFKVTNWGVDSLPISIKRCDVVIIPSIQDERRLAKSPTRLMDSVRMGRFVIADWLPSYEEFNKTMYVKGVIDGLEWIKIQSPKKIKKRIKKCRNYINDLYSPKRIAGEWNKLYSTMKGTNP